VCERAAVEWALGGQLAHARGPVLDLELEELGMVQLGIDPGAAVAAAALTRGVEAPGGEVGYSSSFFLARLGIKLGLGLARG
jgi:hypothetical protein